MSDHTETTMGDLVACAEAAHEVFFTTPWPCCNTDEGEAPHCGTCCPNGRTLFGLPVRFGFSGWRDEVKSLPKELFFGPPLLPSRPPRYPGGLAGLMRQLPTDPPPRPLTEDMIRDLAEKIATQAARTLYQCGACGFLFLNGLTREQVQEHLEECNRG